MPILLSRDSGKTWTSPATVPCDRAAAHNQSQFQCFNGDSIVLRNASSSSGKLSVRTLGMPTPDDDGSVSSLSTQYTVDKSTGKLTVTVLDRQVRFVGTPYKLQ